MNINKFDFSNAAHINYIGKQANKMLSDQQKIVQMGKAEVASPELRQITQIGRELIDKIGKSLADSANQSITTSNKQWLELVLDKITPVVLKNEAIEKMETIDAQIETLHSEIQTLKGQPNSSDIRKAIKAKGEDLKALMDQAVDHLAKLDGQVDSAVMRLCCSRLNVIQEMKDDLTMHSIFLTKEKHEANASPILQAADPARELHERFARGEHQSVRSYLKLGTEADAVLRGVEGVANLGKNQQTLDIESAFKSLLVDFDNTKVTVENRQKSDDAGNPVSVQVISITTVDNKKVEFTSEDLAKVDFSKIEVTSAQMNKYEEFCTDSSSKALAYKPETFSGSKILPSKSYFKTTENQFSMEEDGKKIAYPYKLAINVYTGNAYGAINFFMKGNLPLASKMAKLTPEKTAKEMLLHSVMCLKALNQLDDFAPPDGKVYLWRGEGSSFKDFGALDQYKQAVDQGGAYIDSAGFLSTAYDKPSDSFFNENSPAGILIKGAHGKKVIAWSQFGDSEREVLLPPVKLKLENYKEVMVNGKDVTFFTASLAKYDPLQNLKMELDVSKKAAHSMKTARDTCKVMDQQQQAGWFNRAWQTVIG